VLNVRVEELFALPSEEAVGLPAGRDARGTRRAAGKE
jgi:hypothetical protein